MAGAAAEQLVGVGVREQRHVAGRVAEVVHRVSLLAVAEPADPGGAGTSRRLRCCCAGRPDIRGHVWCPHCLLLEQHATISIRFGLTRNRDLEFDLPLFPTEVGEACQKSAVVATINEMEARAGHATVNAFGDNNYGQCDVPDLNGVVATAAGHQHSCALQEDGDLQCTSVEPVP